MTAFPRTADVGNLEGTRWEPLQATVDTGSSFSTFPRATLERLGVRPERQESFQLANGAVVRCDVATVQVRLEGKTGPSLAIFGEPGEPNLIGAHTLESLLLGVDPVNERLIPIVGLRLSRFPHR